MDWLGEYPKPIRARGGPLESPLGTIIHPGCPWFHYDDAQERRPEVHAQALLQEEDLHARCHGGAAGGILIVPRDDDGSRGRPARLVGGAGLGTAGSGDGNQTIGEAPGVPGCRGSVSGGCGR